MRLSDAPVQLAAGSLPFAHTRSVADPRARYRRGVRGAESTVMLCAGVQVVDNEALTASSGSFFDVDEVLRGDAGELVVGHADLVHQAVDTYSRLRTPD